MGLKDSGGAAATSSPEQGPADVLLPGYAKVDASKPGWAMHAGAVLPDGLQDTIDTIVSACVDQNRGLTPGALVTGLLAVVEAARAQGPELGIEFSNALGEVAGALEFQPNTRGQA